MSRFLKSLVPIFTVALMAFASLSQSAFAQVNTAPKPNIVGQNGIIAPQILSTDPQIGDCIFDATGVSVTSTTQAVLADATHFPCLVLRGAGTVTSASGYERLMRNRLYRVNFTCNATGVNGATVVADAAISQDGGSTFAAISGLSSRFVALTGSLSESLSGTGYVSVASTSTNLAAGNVLIVLRLSSSTGAASCANGGGIYYEAVDQQQPAVYP